jgi:hypothetical protein
MDKRFEGEQQMPDLTEVIFIISRAGPMEFIWSDSAAGFNGFLSHQKTVPVNMRLTLVLFDRDHELLCDGCEIDSVKPLRNTPYTLGGDNAVLDAVGRTIQYVSKRLAGTPDEGKPANIIVVIVTDGHDRISFEFTYKQIAKMIRNERQENGWRFILASAGEDPPGMASAITIESDNTYHFEPTGAGVRKLFNDLDERITAFMNS